MQLGHGIELPLSTYPLIDSARPQQTFARLVRASGYQRAKSALPMRRQAQSTKLWACDSMIRHIQFVNQHRISIAL
jgi:hypothetical protein